VSRQELSGNDILSTGRLLGDTGVI